jgi:ASC-1-like (ASCH) protein
VHELNVRKPYLKLIAEGTKTVEVRVGDPKVREIQVDQLLRFVAGDHELLTRVRRIAQYASFRELVDQEDPRAIGGDLAGSKTQVLAIIRSMYPPDRERLGAFAIEVECVASSTTENQVDRPS